MLLKWIILTGIGLVAWRFLSGLAKPATQVVAGNKQADPYGTLGLSSKASLAEVKKAYQSQIAQYHPDKVASLGPELQELAQEKTQALNAAYDAIKRQKKS